MSQHEALPDIELVDPQNLSLEAAANHGAVEFDDKPRDKCGVVGVYAPGQRVVEITMRGMRGVQHRGQDGAGVAYDTAQYPNLIYINKGEGLIGEAIRDVISPRADFHQAYGSTMALGQTRYGTSYGTDSSQPFSGQQYPFAVAHNGNIPNMLPLARKYNPNVPSDQTDTRLFTGLVDDLAFQYNSLDRAIMEVTPQLEGAFCFTILDNAMKRLIAIRDTRGYHPLVLGSLGEGAYAVVSEQAALKNMRAKFTRHIERGEIVVLDEKGEHSYRIPRTTEESICGVDLQYVARPDGEIDGIGVKQSRRMSGYLLASLAPVQADLVVGLPSSGSDVAFGYAEASGLPLDNGVFEVDPYAKRTFISKGDKLLANQDKLRCNGYLVKDKIVVVGDDSMIRANTATVATAMLLDAGAKEVHFRIGFWESNESCHMGIATADPSQLIARGRTGAEIAAIIGANSVVFNTVENVQRAARLSIVTKLAGSTGRLCTACHDGNFPFKLPASAVGNVILRDGELVSA